MPIAAVQNRFHPGNRGGAEAHAVTPEQVALAWLLACSPVIRLIPGTSRVRHLEENLGAVGLTLTGAECEVLTSLAGRP